MTRIIIPDAVLERQMMTHPSSQLKFTASMQRGEVREAMGWSFVSRLEKLVNELLAKNDCPDKFWIIYSAKWSKHERRIKEMWQVDDAKPKIHMLGQIIYEVHKSGYADYWALPLDVPVPDDAYSDNAVVEHSSKDIGYFKSQNIPLSEQQFEKV